MKDKIKNKKNKLNLEKNKFNTIELLLMFIMALALGLLLGEMIFSNTSTNSLTKKTNNEIKEIENVYNSLIEEYVGKVNKEELKEAAIEGMISHLEDKYSIYYNKEESKQFEEELKGTYYGIGAEIYRAQNKNITVNKVYKNSPSEKAGLKKGDEIIKINNKELKDKTTEEVSKLIKSKKSQTITLTIKRENKTYNKKLTTEEIEIPSVKTEIIKNENKKIGYIQITIFSSNTDEQFAKALENLKKENITNLIIDVRDNIGGELDTVVNIASNFLAKDDIVIQTISNNKTKKITSNKNSKKDYNIVVLINNGSASGSEVLAATLNENCNAELIGDTTYGKGTVQKTKKLASGSIIKYTVETWKTGKGKDINGKGVKPTIKINQSEKYYETQKQEDDAQLQKAIEILQNKNQ